MILRTRFALCLIAGTLSAGCSVVRIEDPDGNPVVGATITLHALDEDCNFMTWEMPPTDTNGMTLIDGYADEDNYVPHGSKVWIEGPGVYCEAREHVYEKKYCSGNTCKYYVLHDVTQSAGGVVQNPCNWILPTAQRACKNTPYWP